MMAKAYLGDIIGGSIMLRESRLMAQLLLQHPDDEAWEREILEGNLLQKSSIHSVKRMASTLRKRLDPMRDAFWSQLLTAPDDLARQMLMLAVMCQSPVLIDFMATEVADARRMYREAMRSEDWPEFFASRQRVITGLEHFSPSSIQKMGSNIFKILADVGYLESARSKRLKAVYLLPEIREWANRLNCPKAYEAMEAAR